MPTPFQIRNQQVRRRVEDALHQIGHGDMEAGKARFIDHALWCARRNEMRMWQGVSREQIKQVATRSLGTLLGDLQIPDGKGGTWTGRNVNWVLDIWEVAVDDWFRVSEVRVIDEDEIAPVMAQAIEARKPLSLRILEAYLERDDEAMVHLMEEVEDLQ